MGRRYGYGDHHWIEGDGARGLRGVRGDRCKRCGLQRAKRNGKRVYWWPGETSMYSAFNPTSAPACDPKRLQPDLFAAGPSAAAKGHAQDPVRVPPIGATRK